MEKQINELFKKEEKYVKVSYILSRLNFSNFLTDSNSKFTLVSVIRLYIFRLIKGIRNYEKLKEYLQENEEEAFQLGIYRDENNRLDIPPKRTYNHYLQKIDKEQLNLIAKKILSIATKNEVILDLEIVKKTVKKEKENNQKKIKETTKLIKKLVYPNIDLNLHHNAKFKNKDFLDVLTYVASKNYYANDGSKLFHVDNENNKTPSGDLMMYHFSKFKSPTQLREMFEKILDVVFNYCKRNYNILQQRKLNIAYDIHDVNYYGKNMSYVCGGKYDKGTSNFFKFLTCSIVVAGRRFILDVIPIHPLDIIHKLLDESLERVKKKIRIEGVYLDRGFNSSKIINTLKEHNVKFIMPQTKTPTVKNWFDKSEAIKSRVIPNFQIGRGKDKALVNLVLVNDKRRIKRAFICNFNIAPQLAYGFYGMYSKRWGIETTFRILVHDFRAKTTSNNYHIRLFYFLFSSCLYNLWVLVNICVSLAVYGRIKDKPIITAKMFAILLYKVQIEYWDGG